MTIRIFVISEEQGKVDLSQDYEIIWVISGDDTTSMSLGHFISPRGEGRVFVKNDIFVSLMPKHTSPLELRIDQPLIPRENFCIVVKNFRDLEDIFNSTDDDEENEMSLAREDDYDFFSGNEVTSDSKIIRKDIFKRMSELKELTHVFIDAGFLDDREDVPEYLPRKIDDWMVTFEDPLQKLFTLHTLPEVSASDMTIEEEFLINPSFRKGITIYWMRVVANFMVNNDITSIEEVGTMGVWEDPDVWEEIKKMEIKDEK